MTLWPAARNFGVPGREGSHDMAIAEATDVVMQQIKRAGGETSHGSWSHVCMTLHLSVDNH